METIKWSKLGPPTEPGNVRIQGLGVVDVRQEDIDNAKDDGDDPVFELLDTTSGGDKTRCYLLGLMR